MTTQICPDCGERLEKLEEFYVIGEPLKGTLWFCKCTPMTCTTDDNAL